MKASALGPANREWEGKVLCNPHGVGLLAVGEQAGNPIASPLSSLDTAGGPHLDKQSDQSRAHFNSLTASLSLCYALHFSDVTIFSL